MLMGRRHLALVGLGLALLLGFGLVVARSGPLAPVPVTVAKVGTGSIDPSLFGIGTVEARRSYFIGPTIAGRVLYIKVDVGDHVQAGQVLAEMDPVDLNERQGSLQASQSRARSAVFAAEAQRKDALARQELATINHNRYTELNERRFVSSSALDGTRQALVSARALLEAAEANVQGARQELARLEADERALAQQRRNLLLVAPQDSVVTSRDAEPGSTVVAGQSVIKLMQPDSLWVRVRLDQGRSRGLANGMEADVVLRSSPTHKLAGTLVRIEPLSDSVTEERIAFVKLNTMPAGLTVGELAEVTLRAVPATSALLLPNAAVKTGAQGSGVWVLRDGKPAFAKVTLGDSSLDGQVQIRSGLQAGDEVVIYSERDLTTGTRVKVVDRLTEGQS